MKMDLSLLKIFQNYSPNFSQKKRHINKIKFLIFHYTGMQKESDAIKKLTSLGSDVSCHYFIKKKGEILLMVPDSYIAWHAGKSKWKKFMNLNNNSIGIELTNKGHQFGYENFSLRQINSLIKICKNLKKNIL